MFRATTTTTSPGTTNQQLVKEWRLALDDTMYAALIAMLLNVMPIH